MKRTMEIVGMTRIPIKPSIAEIQYHITVSQNIMSKMAFLIVHVVRNIILYENKNENILIRLKNRLNFSSKIQMIIRIRIPYCENTNIKE